MKTNTKQTENLDECGNKSKPLLSSRLFKFRAWDNCYNKIVYKGISEDSIIAVGVEGTIFKIFMDSSYEINGYLSGIFDDRFEIMQSTGLFDKNGVEIFEGDFLKNPEGRIGFVSYENGCFGLTIHKSDTSSHRLIFNLGFLENKEVVGNIFENPELL